MVKNITVTALLFVAFFTLIPSAMAQSAQLVDYTPKESKVLIGLNMPALRGTDTFREVMDVVKQSPQIADLINMLQSEADISIEKDIDGVIVAMPEAVQNPNAANANDTITVALRGRFNQDKIIAALKKRDPKMKVTETKGKVTTYATKKFTVGFAGKQNDLVLTSGADGFQTKTWTAVNDAKKSAGSDKTVKKVMNQINTKRGLWLVGITKGMSQQGPKMNNAGMTIDIRKGLTIDVIGNMASVKDAKAAAKEFGQLKQQASNPMVGMLGATPLVTNLKTSQEKSTVKMNTKMSAKEFKQMRNQIKMMMTQGQQQMQSGAPAKGDAPPKTKKGAAADFN